MPMLDTLPPEALVAGLTLRPLRPGDRRFMDALFISVRGAEVDAGMPLATPAQRRDFLRSQAALQYQHYLNYPDTSGFGILTHRRQPVGRLFLAPEGDAIRLVDIVLLPEWRGRGLGQALLGAVMRQAAAEGRPVTLSVDLSNPAQRLYARLGFLQVAVEGFYRQLRWTPPTPSLIS